jgi:hypothetical protein
VGCAQKAFVKDEQVIEIEGDPDSLVSRGRLCPRRRIAAVDDRILTSARGALPTPARYEFLGSYLLAQAIDDAGADLAVHAHAHFGTEHGITNGGVR